MEAKAGLSSVEQLEHSASRHSHFEHHDLSAEHKQYLLERHGTLDLEPVPDPGPQDPLNWPLRKKLINLALVAWHAASSTFISSAIIPAYETIAQDLNVSLQRATYLTSLQIIILGVAPFIWGPVSSRYGRRPVFLLSLLFSLIGNVGCANSPTYGSMAACRALVAFFISPAGAIGSGVVTETFFKRERARYMGVWTLLLTLGVPLAPFIFGFVASRVHYRWIYYILAIMNGVHLLLYAFLGPETRYVRTGDRHVGATTRKDQYWSMRRIDPRPLGLKEFYHPLAYATKMSVLVSTCAYSMTFLFGSIMITIEIPQLFGEKFNFGAQSLGLQFIGVILGAVIGEQIGGYSSDLWMKRAARRSDGQVAPEFRLWLGYPGFVIACMGAVVFLVQIANATTYNVSPIVGAAFAAGGTQIVTTVMVTYAVDCYAHDASSVGVFVTFVRQTWAFIGPFWLPSMFDSVGLKISAVIVSALIIGVSILPVAALHFAKYRLGSVDK